MSNLNTTTTTTTETAKQKGAVSIENRLLNDTTGKAFSLSDLVTWFNAPATKGDSKAEKEANRVARRIAVVQYKGCTSDLLDKAVSIDEPAAMIEAIASCQHSTQQKYALAHCKESDFARGIAKAGSVSTIVQAFDCENNAPITNETLVNLGMNPAWSVADSGIENVLDSLRDRTNAEPHLFGDLLSALQATGVITSAQKSPRFAQFCAALAGLVAENAMSVAEMFPLQVASQTEQE